MVSNSISLLFIKLFIKMLSNVDFSFFFLILDSHLKEVKVERKSHTHTHTHQKRKEGW